MKKFKIFDTYSGLPFSIYILFLVKIINALGAFVGPFLTMFLSDKLGFSKSTIGVFITLNAVSMVPGSLLGGKLCDSFGRKKILVLFQASAALCYIPCAFLGKSVIIPYILILSSFLNAVAQPANTAMVADLTDVTNRKEAFSLLYLGNNLGFSVGPMIAGFLYAHYLKLLFIGNSLAVFICVTIIFMYIKETKPKKEDELLIKNELEKAEDGNMFELLLKRPLLLCFAIFSIVYSFIYAQYPFCIPLQVKGIFSNYSVVYGKIMATNGITVIVCTTFITKLTKKLSSIQNISLAGIFYAAGFGMMYFIRSFPMFIFATFVWTLGEILQSTNTGVYVANHTPMSHRGRFNSVIPLISEAGFALGPTVMGLYIKNRNVTDAWPIVFILAITASGLFFMLNLAEKKKV